MVKITETVVVNKLLKLLEGQDIKGLYVCTFPIEGYDNELGITVSSEDDQGFTFHIQVTDCS